MTKPELYKALQKILIELSNLEEKIRNHKEFKKIPDRIAYITGEIEKILLSLLPLWKGRKQTKIQRK